MSDARLRLPLFVLTFALFWALTPAAPVAGFARTIESTARALVANGTLDVAPYGDAVALPSTVVHDGRRRATSALGAALALLPAAICARATATLDPTGRIARTAASGTAAALAALVCVLFFALLRGDGLSRRAALGFTLALAFATPLVWFARVADGTALATLLLTVAVATARAFVVADDRGSALRLGLALGALVIVQPTLLLAALVVVAWCGLHRHARLGVDVAARVLAPLAAGIVVVLAHRWHVGAPAEPMGDLLQGLDGLLLSTGKSIFLYAPLVMLAPAALWWMWHAHRADAQLVIAVAAAVLVAAAALDDWHGDPTWGPRRVVPLVPLAVEAVARAWAARTRRGRASVLLALLVAGGVGVQTVGVAIAPTTYLAVLTDVRIATGAPSWFAEAPSEAHFIPQFSPLVGHAWLLSRLVRGDRRLEVNPPYKLLLANPPKLDNVWPRLGIDWFARTWPPAVAAPWLALLLVVAAIAARALGRRLDETVLP